MGVVDIRTIWTMSLWGKRLQNATGKLESQKIAMHVLDRGERASDARISSVFIMLGVVSPTSDDLEVAIAQQVQDCAL